MANQAPPLVDFNAGEDQVLTTALEQERASWAIGEVTAFGKSMGSEEALHSAREANRHTPELQTHDAAGERLDFVEFHPAWHWLMASSIGAGLHALPWRTDRPGAHPARAAKFFIASQTEAGHGCPVSMTHAAVPALRHHPDIAEVWVPAATSVRYDPTFAPVEHKMGALIGMGMTERQGGSDVRSNTTRARPLERGGGPGATYKVDGHKWFCSAPMSDAFLVLAQAEGGLSCVLLPRFRADGSANGFHIDRLKDKLGNRSNASAEVRFEAAEARLVGEEGAGLDVILEMVNHTRLDCVIGSAALMRQSVIQAHHHARHRKAFGKLLIEQPLMRSVLADLALESEGAMVTMMRLASLFEPDADPALRRVATPIAKYWVCKRTPSVVAEALECLGGNGYVETSPLPRLFRESPLNSIWEGSGNVICLDVMRALRRSPGAADAMTGELEAGRGFSAEIDRWIDDAVRLIDEPPDEASARWFVGQVALAWQAGLLARIVDPASGADLVAARAERNAGVFGGHPGREAAALGRVPTL